MPRRGRRPPVSVCIPVHNGMRYLEECLASVLGQTFRDFELLIVDDASTDGTADFVARRLRADPRLRLCRNPRNLGLVGNWNRCVQLAGGRWVKFVFQDDTLAPACLERLLAAARPGVPLVACRRSLRLEAGVHAGVGRMYRRHFAEYDLGRIFPGRRHIPAEEFARLMLRDPVHNCIGEPTAVMIRRSVFKTLGLFNPDLVSLCDWEFFARAAVHGGLCYIDESLADFRVHPHAMSSRNRRSWPYRTEHLDALILRHELAHAPVYAPVRRVAGLRTPRVDFLSPLAAAARRSRALAVRLRRRAAGPGADAWTAWLDAVRRYPRLSGIPARPRPADRRLAAARGLWGSRPPC